MQIVQGLITLAFMYGIVRVIASADDTAVVVLIFAGVALAVMCMTAKGTTR